MAKAFVYNHLNNLIAECSWKIFSFWISIQNYSYLGKTCNIYYILEPTTFFYCMLHTSAYRPWKFSFNEKFVLFLISVAYQFASRNTEKTIINSSISWHTDSLKSSKMSVLWMLWAHLTGSQARGEYEPMICLLESYQPYWDLCVC